MKIKNTSLTALAILAICNTGYAVAYDPREQRDLQPSVEVNMNVLDTLRNSTPMPTPGPTSPEHDFISEKPVKYPQKTASGKHAHHKKHATVHKHPKAPVVPNETHKVDTAPEIKVTPSEQEPSPVMVNIPRDNGSAKPIGNAGGLPPLLSLPESSKSPGLPPLPSESHGAVTPPSVQPSTPTQPPLPEKKPEFIMAPSGQIMQAPAPAEPTPPPAVTPPAPSAPASPPGVPSLPPLPSAGETGGAMTPPSGAPSLPPLPGADKSGGAVTPPGLPEIPAPPSASGAAPAMPPLPSASSSSSALPPPPPAAGEAVSGAPAAASGPAPDLQIVFNEAETDLPMGMSSKLDQIASQLTAHSSLRVSIVAYASGSDAVSIYPKRVSLARGIAVRNYLVAKGIDVERITVKALGNKNEGGPANRVDLFTIK